MSGILPFRRRMYGPALVWALLAGCGPAAPVAEKPKPDPTRAAWYGASVAKLMDLNRQAENLYTRGQAREAGELVTQGQPLANRLLQVPRPTLEAMEAASDLDQLYGRMLFAERNYGWARLEFQKNVARWRNWRPQTADTARRLKLAQTAIAACDRELQ